MLNRITLFLFAAGLLAGCSSSRTDSLFKCEGGDLRATISDVRSSNVKPSTLTTKKVLSTASVSSGLELIASECPIPLGVDRIIRITLYEHPSIGKVYTLSSPAAEKPSYLTYTEHSLDVETITSKQEWIATGTMRVASMVGQTIVLQTDNLIMRPRTDMQKNQAEGSFRMEIQLQADGVTGL